MPKSVFGSVDACISSQPESSQRVLTEVRAAIRRAVPTADEMITYGLPTYKLHGRAVIYFAGWKKHYSVYPSTDRVVGSFKDELAGYEVNKGTIRFPLSGPVPGQLIYRIARVLLKEATERQARATRKRR